MSYNFPFSEADTVIELGGGTQPYFRPNLDVRSGPNIDIVADFNEVLPINDNQYDGVFSCYCIEHLSWRKVRLFISEVYRILKNNGRAVFITANTERQMQHVLAQEEWNDDSSCIIFGDQDYPENTHRNSLCPRYAIQLMAAAGFSNVVVLPWGALGTDMIIEVKKTSSKPVFDRNYFDNPHFYGENTGFYRDHPTNWIVFNKLMQLQPRSILELGCGRGYILKRLQAAGVVAHGLEISRHCLLTRVTDEITHFDIRQTPWPFNDQEFDVIFSHGVLDYIEPEILPKVLAEAERVSKSGLHGIDTKQLNLNWKNQKFVDSQELIRGSLAHSVPQGDGKMKLNIGSFTVMLHNGWINTDVIDLTQYAIENQFKFLPMDSTKPLPFESGTVDFIISSHMLEHLSWEEGLSFLRECNRIMKPGAVMRIAVPDTEKLISLYQNKELHKLDEMNCNAARFKSQTPKFWSFLFDGHKIAYDWESLQQIGQEAGFYVMRCVFNQGNPTLVKETMDYLPEISIYVEMYKN
jgi:predicted SAM-dependent methyltransferase